MPEQAAGSRRRDVGGASVGCATFGYLFIACDDGRSSPFGEPSFVEGLHQYFRFYQPTAGYFDRSWPLDFEQI
jgi:hypothetical protein